MDDEFRHLTEEEKRLSIFDPFWEDVPPFLVFRRFIAWVLRFVIEKPSLQQFMGLILILSMLLLRFLFVVRNRQSSQSHQPFTIPIVERFQELGIDFLENDHTVGLVEFVPASL